MRIVALIAFLCATSAAAFAADDPKLAAPPSGIGPTSATVAEVLRLHDKSIGTLAAGVENTRRETWSLNDVGSLGTETLVRRGVDYHAKIQHGPLVEEYGQFDGKRWHLDLNGSVSPTQDVEGESFVMLRVLEDAGDPKNDVKLLGEVGDPKPAYVLEIQRSGFKRPEWVFYDKATGLVTRTEKIVRGERLVSTYDDYREREGLTEPWHVHDTLGETGIEFDYRRKALVIGDPVGSSELEAPAGHFAPASYSGEVELPAHFRYDTVTVRLTINGRGLDFELATGAPESLIDRDVARELDLPTFGQLTTTAKGDNLGYDTQIEHATIGSLALTNFGVRALEFNYHASQDTKVVGLLGYDFLSNAFVKIDYPNEKVTLLDPAGADELAAGPGTTVIPVSFDDGMPFIKGSLAEHATDNILLDNSFPFTLISGSFSNRYPEAVPDMQGHKHVHTMVPFADSKSYGRDVDIWLSLLKTAHFGPVTFNNLEMIVTNADPFEHDIDAVIGANLLHYFDVYVDFPHSRVILKANQWFAKKFRYGPP